MSDATATPKITAGAVVCNESSIVGDVTIGTRTVVHPKARIIAQSGPIFIGENNIIEERVTIINDLKNSDGKNTVPVMIIGNNNVFEVDAFTQALKIGDNNVLESKSKVARNVELTSGCVVGAGCSLSTEEIIPENTVIFGENNQRRRQHDRPPPPTLQIEFLAKVLPNYHHLRKANMKK